MQASPTTSGPAMPDSTPATQGNSAPVIVRGWPRWAAAVLTVSGLVIIFVETTSLLFFAGLLLVGFGIYGFVAGSRSRRTEPSLAGV
jgi:hypothetical protein